MSCHAMHGICFWNIFLLFIPVTERRHSNTFSIWTPLHVQHSHTQSPSVPQPCVCMNLRGASCQWHTFISTPQACSMTYPPSPPFVFCWVMCCLLIPCIFSWACVLCSAENMRKNANDSASWCCYCHNGVTMARVESQFMWLIWFCLPLFFLLSLL